MFDWIAANYIEIIAALLGIAGVWLTTRQNIWCWPIGLANVMLSMIVFFTAKLYYDFVLQIFYFVLTFYGWFQWLSRGKNSKSLRVTNLKSVSLLLSAFIIIVSVAVFGKLATMYTDASLPYWDAFTTSGGIIATFWMARKKIENWIAWVVIDIVCTFIYIYKELYAFSALYFIFAILAVVGYLRWKKDLQTEQQ